VTSAQPTPGTAPPLAALLLAGGRSRRMQRDKALVEYDGESQLARAWRTVAGVVPDAYLSIRLDQADDPVRAAYPRMVDRDAELGPAAGLLAAFATRPTHAWLVVAIDLPLLDRHTLEHLLAARDPAKLATAYTSTHDGLPEPLCAIWEPTAHAALRSFVAGGRHCPRKFLLNHAARLVPPAATNALDNVNTPEEYAAVRARLAGGAASPRAAATSATENP
jgi:molybdopterin-guanine dinucleotide biosynthesis protein A